MSEPSPALKPESVWDYPRPPAIEAVPQRIRVVFNGVQIADTRRAWRILETSHPPAYYIPEEDILPGALRALPGTTWCEWKGEARYFDVVVGEKTAGRAAWAYPEPTSGYGAIKECVAFYPQKMDACFVGDEQAQPQQGKLYGGWITSNLRGPFKGAPGTSGW